MNKPLSKSNHTYTDSSPRYRFGEAGIFDIPIFSKLYEFYRETYEILRKFPQRERYSLGQKIENIILEVFELISKINMADKSQKLQILQNINAKLDLEKVLIRLAKDNKCVDNKNYLHLQESLQELGKMTGGFIRYLKNS